MVYTSLDLLHLALCLTTFLAFAHGMGFVFRYFRQPQVIGEITGGLLLGPTVLGYFCPQVSSYFFSLSDKSAPVLGAIYQLGLLLLMFCSGMEMRSSFQKGERRTALFITLTGIFFPLLACYFFSDAFALSRFSGISGSPLSLFLIFSIAVAVTSIPVISRILMDLKVIATPFSRIVLSAAVIEDVILYVLLGIALSLSGIQSSVGFGMPDLLQLEKGSKFELVYHVFVTLLFLGMSLWLGPKLFSLAEKSRFNILKKNNPIGFFLIFLLLMTTASLILDVAPMFGAFAAGLVVGATNRQDFSAGEAIRGFAFAFFIPIYFAIVGFRLDLLGNFPVLFFISFLGFACLVKIISVFLGAKLAHEKNWSALNLSVAMNARGGPGIVLASVAFDSKIINAEFYACLVMLSIVTSMLAGKWLQFVLGKKWELR